MLVSVNDVVLALCAGALRRWLLLHDALPDASLIAAVPAQVVEASVELAQRRQGQQGLDRAFLEAARSLLWLLGLRAHTRAMLAAVTAPVLLLHGDADRLVPLAAARTAPAT
jgi:pimeloyl-ACP methyl ester carboxylesterase